jgi:hypothetical protein
MQESTRYREERSLFARSRKFHEPPVNTLPNRGLWSVPYIQAEHFSTFKQKIQYSIIDNIKQRPKVKRIGGKESAKASEQGKSNNHSTIIFRSLQCARYRSILHSLLHSCTFYARNARCSGKWRLLFQSAQPDLNPIDFRESFPSTFNLISRILIVLITRDNR